MIFRQLFDAETSTFTYLVADPVTRQAALIDPVLEQVDRDLALIGELGLCLSRVLETHVHADHVTGASSLRERTGAITVAGNKAAPCADLHVKHGFTPPTTTGATPSAPSARKNARTRAWRARTKPPSWPP